MSKVLRASVAFVVAFLVAAQFVRPNRANPPIDASHTIRAQVGSTTGLADVLDRSCNDCHSNESVWPRAARIAPLSWVMAYAVREGRKAVNFSEWSTYSPTEQRTLLDASCADASSGKMPSVYTWVRPETRLSTQDIETICAAARKSEANAASSEPQSRSER
jgi:hypothetical protein